MSRGGARNRSGPQPDPNSARSERRGFKLTALPSEGYAGDVPVMPIGPSATDELTAARERAIWAEAWTTPQACAWSMESWRWPVVAEYARLKAVVEMTPSASAALVSQLHRYRDQLGLTPAGLKENGWSIAADEVGERRSGRPADDRPVPAPRARRLRAADGGQ